jgi:hypothetical protein
MSLEGSDKAGDEIFIREIEPKPSADWGNQDNWGTDADRWGLQAVTKQASYDNFMGNSRNDTTSLCSR